MGKLKYFLALLRVIFVLFGLNLNGLNAQVMVTSTGKLGIGTQSPTAVLDVHGNIRSDSSIVGKAIVADQIIVGNNIIGADLILGKDATFLGALLAISGNILGPFTAISGDFVTNVSGNDFSGNSAQFTELNSSNGTFTDQVEIGQDLIIGNNLFTQNLYVEDSIIAINGVFENLRSTEFLIAQSGIFSQELYLEGKTYLRDTTYVEGILMTEDDIEYVNPKTYTHNLSALSFEAQGPFTANPWIKKENYGYLYQAGADSVVLNAPLHLTDGVRIKKIGVLFYDQSINHNIDTIDISLKSIYKTGVPQPTIEFMAGIGSYNELFSNQISTEEFLLPGNGLVIDNALKTYYFTLRYRVTNNNANENLRFYGLTIEYEVSKIKGI